MGTAARDTMDLGGFEGFRYSQKNVRARGRHWRPLTARGVIEGYRGHVPGKRYHGTSVVGGAYAQWAYEHRHGLVTTETSPEKR